MNPEVLRHWFSRVQQIVAQQRKIAEITGENFNIFRILNVESSEVRLHSVLLAEFLNPKGSHGQGDIYLKLFVEQLGIHKFDTLSAKVDVEKHAGTLCQNTISGGRIDILLTDKNNSQIIIENKIYAQDQENQLLRYYNYNNNAHLFYLTINGEKPSVFSTGGILSDDHYRVISYKNEIINWLHSCRKESVNIPIVREALTQYLHLLKHLSNQTEQDSMKNEIQKFIVENPEFIESIEICYKELDAIIRSTKSTFKSILDSKMPPAQVIDIDGISIKCTWGEDGDGVFFGYKAFDGEKNVTSQDIIGNYSRYLKDINNEFHTAGSWIGWINPMPFNRGEKFEHIKRSEIIKMYQDTDLIENLVNQILAFEQDIRQQFLEKIQCPDCAPECPDCLAIK